MTIAIALTVYAVQAADCMQLLTSLRRAMLSCVSRKFCANGRIVRDVIDGTVLCVTRKFVVETSHLAIRCLHAYREGVTPEQCNV